MEFLNVTVFYIPRFTSERNGRISIEKSKERKYVVHVCSTRYERETRRETKRGQKTIRGRVHGVTHHV